MTDEQDLPRTVSDEGTGFFCAACHGRIVSIHRLRPLGIAYYLGPPYDTLSGLGIQDWGRDQIDPHRVGRDQAA